MPEGPEVRRYADRLAALLDGEAIVSLTARTRLAKQWLQANPDLLVGRRIERVRSHGKHLLGWLEGGYYFYSHLMMWGRWLVVDVAPTEIDRRERARIIVSKGAALLYSAPIFELGQGDPTQAVAEVQRLGVDVLPYDGEFDQRSFQQRLLAPENRERAIGVALLDQQIVAGIGNYLRAEILFICRVDPWRRVADLSAAELLCLSTTIPQISRRAYETGGVTVSDAARAQMQQDATLVYRPNSEFGDRHYVFRRTNLPCLVCGNSIRQLRQTTRQGEDGEKSRIIYFCPHCQNTQVELKPAKRRTQKLSQPVVAELQDQE